MENSANQENAKQQPAEDQQPNIETVTPDLENVHPLARQESEEGKEAEATDQEQNTQESLPVQDNSDAENSSNEENTSTSAEQTDESDPRDDIETVSP